MNIHLNDLTHLAAQYCGLIEQPPSDNAMLLERLNSLLPRLHAAVAGLNLPSYSALPDLPGDLEQRFELYCRLCSRLGDWDPYWQQFDDISATGSLADDLTDIYCELKLGLERLPGELRQVVQGWTLGYRYHWGQHLVDAERHLYHLQARGLLENVLAHDGNC